MAPPLPARAPPLPARAPPVRISNNQQRTYDQVQHRSYPDNTAHGGAGGYGGYRDVTHHYDEDEEGGFHGEDYQGEGEDDEEVHEQEQEPEYEQEEDYPGGEPVEYDGEEQVYHAHNHGGYHGAGQMVEEGEDEYDGGYGY